MDLLPRIIMSPSSGLPSNALFAAWRRRGIRAVTVQLIVRTPRPPSVSPRDPRLRPRTSAPPPPAEQPLGFRRHGCPSAHLSHLVVVSLYRTADPLRLAIRAHAPFRGQLSSCGPTPPLHFLGSIRPYNNSPSTTNTSGPTSIYSSRSPSRPYHHHQRRRRRQRLPHRCGLRPCRPHRRHHRWTPFPSRNFKVFWTLDGTVPR